MHIRTVLATGILGVAACVPGTPVYLGAAYATVQGSVFSLEDRTPIAGAEVCMLGADTTCARTDLEGAYKLFSTEPQTVSITFRMAGARPAMVDSVSVVPPGTYIVDCTMSTIVTISTAMGSCREHRDGR